MPPEDQAVASLFFKDESDPSDPKNANTKGFGWNKKKRDQSKEKSQGRRKSSVESQGRRKSSADGYTRAK